MDSGTTPDLLGIGQVYFFHAQSPVIIQ